MTKDNRHLSVSNAVDTVACDVRVHPTMATAYAALSRLNFYSEKGDHRGSK